MKKTLAILATVALLTVSMASTANAGGGNKAFWGTILGAAGGGIGGAQFGNGKGKTAATIIGTLLGAGVGQNVGRSLDRVDDIYDSRYNRRVVQQPRYQPQPRYQQQRPVYRQQPRYQQRTTGTIFGTRDNYQFNQSQATYQSLEYGRSGEVLPWQNQNGQRGAIIPEPAYQNQYGQYCREYTKEVEIGGRIQQAYGTACRMSDGQWQIVSSSN